MTLTKLIEVNIQAMEEGLHGLFRIPNLEESNVIVVISRSSADVMREYMGKSTTIGDTAVDPLAAIVSKYYMDSLPFFFIEKNEIEYFDSDVVTWLKRKKKAEWKELGDLLRDSLFRDSLVVMSYKGELIAKIMLSHNSRLELYCHKKIYDFLKDNIQKINQYVLNHGRRGGIIPDIHIRRMSLAKLLSGEEVYGPTPIVNFHLQYYKLGDYQRLKSRLNEGIRKGDLIEADVVDKTKKGVKEDSPISKAPYLNVAIGNKTSRVIILKDEGYKNCLSQLCWESIPKNTRVRVEVIDASNLYMITASLKEIVYGK